MLFAQWAGSSTGSSSCSAAAGGWRGGSRRFPAAPASNPTIFAKAITGSDRYDDQLRALIEGGERDSRELFFALGLEDVRRAADHLRSIYEQAEGYDGFASFECTPDLADDTEATITQALELWGGWCCPTS